jgi:mRNA deadenylase 3'-5' endonuclease subunit Ccr4
MALVVETKAFCDFISHNLFIKPAHKFWRIWLIPSSEQKSDKYSQRAQDFSSRSRHFQIYFCLQTEEQAFSF